MGKDIHLDPRPKCEAPIFPSGTFHARQCSRYGVVQDRDKYGDLHWHCRQHSDKEAAARQSKAQAIFDAQQAARQKPYQRIKELEAKVVELEAELLERENLG